MYTGNNPIAKRSLSDISDAMFGLLKKNLYPEITITMICQEAKVSRQTFYKLFGDKKEVIYYLIVSNYDDFERGVGEKKSLDLQGFTEYTFYFFYERKVLLELLVRQQLEQYFIEVVQSKLKDVLQLFQDNTFTCSKPIYHFFTGGLCSMILYQINYEKEEKIKANAAEFAYLLGNPMLLG